MRIASSLFYLRIILTLILILILILFILTTWSSFIMFVSLLTATSAYIGVEIVCYIRNDNTIYSDAYHFIKNFMNKMINKINYATCITHITQDICLNYLPFRNKINDVRRVLPGKLILKNKRLFLITNRDTYSNITPIRYNYNLYLAYLGINPIADIKHKLKPIELYPLIAGYCKGSRQIFAGETFRYVSVDDKFIFYESNKATIILICHDMPDKIHILVFYKKQLLCYLSYDYNARFTYKLKYANESYNSRYEFKFLADEFTDLPFRKNEPRPIGLAMQLIVDNTQIKFYEDATSSNLDKCMVCYDNTVLREIHPCKHKLCFPCVINLTLCPYCRCEIDTIRI